MMTAFRSSPIFILCLIAVSITGGLSESSTSGTPVVPPPQTPQVSAPTQVSTTPTSTVESAATAAAQTTTAPSHSSSVVKSATPSKPALLLTQNMAIKAGILLAFNSGFINGACLGGFVAKSGVKQAVAAVTGAYTTSALFFAEGNYKAFRTQMSVLFSFISGSCIAGLMNPFPTVLGNLSPSCGPAFLLGALLLAAASMLCKGGDSATTPLLAFCLAAIANGMQNSITSVHTANLCRTTHYTGISSDIGTFLGQVLRGNKTNLLKLKVFAGLGASFWTGGVVAFFVGQKFASESLLFSAALYMAIFLSLTFLK